MRTRSVSIRAAVVIALLLGAAFAAAVPLTHLRDFEALHGRYAPGGDCRRQPQIVVDAAGIAFTGGPPLPKADRPDYAATFMGPAYTGIALTFFPYADEPRPFLLTFNADETPGRLTVQSEDFDYPGGPPLPARYRLWVAASPYAKCG